MSDPRNPWSRGCAGCGLALGLALMAVLALVGWAWITTETASSERRENAPESGPQIANAVVRVEAYLATLRIEPAPPEQGIQMEASYDPDSYEIAERSERIEATLHYAVSLERRRLVPVMLARRLMGASVPEIRLTLPRDLPITLEVETLRTDVEIELGSLGLDNVSVVCAKGPLTLDVSEPVTIPPQQLHVRTKLGNVELRGLGNASPAELDVDALLGDLRLDLAGAWQRDALIRVIQGPGVTTLSLPETARVEGIEGTPQPDEAETALPLLEIEMKADELEID